MLSEMRPHRMTEAHQTGFCAELVCSNSFKSNAAGSAPALLKGEMRTLGSLILETADRCAVPAGNALAVDRDLFSQSVTASLQAHPLIDFRPGSEAVDPTPAAMGCAATIIATGPLSSESIVRWLSSHAGVAGLYFYDAIAPIVDAASIDRTVVFEANRYEQGGESAYLNCPLNEDQYRAFIAALLTGEKTATRNFEKEILFQGCQPIESIAATGPESLRFGPMKPVGLTDPRTGRYPFAAIQLRPENRVRTAYNIVGFQTKLKYGEQQRVFRMIPGLEKAEFLRLGSIHRNTYVHAPSTLRPDLSLRGKPTVYVAGQLAGIEGYLESAACGQLAASFVLQRLRGIAHTAPPANSALGALLRHITGNISDHYQPANIHFGLFDPTYYNATGVSRDLAREAIVRESGENLGKWAGMAL